MDERRDAVGVPRGQSVGRRGAPVLPDHAVVLVPEVGHQRGEVLGDGGQVVAGVGVLGVAETAHVRHDDAV